MKELRFDTASASILCVDNDRSLLRRLASLLESAGHCGECCEDVATAIKRARRQTPDLIIAAIDLGTESGLDLMTRIRKIEDMADVPVLFLSSADLPDVVRRAHDAGGSYYLRKPYDPEVLLELVDSALWLPHVVRRRVHAAPKPNSIKPKSTTPNSATRRRSVFR